MHPYDPLQSAHAEEPPRNFDFVVDPDRYRAESASASRFWAVYLPIFCFVFLPVFSSVAPDFFGKWFESERYGILEFQHFLFPLLTALIGLRLAISKTIRSNPVLLAWCLAMFLGGVFLAGEEASWGQHYVGWGTPQAWNEINDQQETNLHNVSNLFDQVPRALLVVGIVLTGTLGPWLLLNRPGLLPRQFNFTYPPLALVPLAALIAACWVYRIFRKWEPMQGYDLLRPGEFQEVFIVWYLLYYALFLLWRVRRLRRAAAPHFEG